eukprot:TRINITY_DN1437_c1_g3_i2.p1 TRINITY_DN1437_c1_g3~~TRINITY_DN1437_c1_g3_i2.p1  ORF type:complete len:1074 (-),score=257.30 TRINITY_DN1437_c1_g3_i2:75-3296(-)
MIAGRTEGVVFAGRLMISCFDYPLARPLSSVKRLEKFVSPLDQPMQEYTLRVDVFECCEIPLDSGSLIVRIGWGSKVFKSVEASCSNGRARFLHGFPDIVMKWPKKREQVPDVFIYVEKVGLTGKERLTYMRLNISQIPQIAAENPPTWFDMKEDKSVDAIPYGEFPGNLLISLAICEGPCSIPRVKIEAPRLEKYMLRAHIYQGRHLVAADDDGSSDPYCVLKVNGKKVKTTVKEKTLYPVWYETLETMIELPEPLTFAPNIHVLVYDKDTFGSDDPLGRFSVPTTSCSQNFPEKPQWYPLKLEDVNIPLGEILASFQLVPLKFTPIPEARITPQMRPSIVEVTLVGLRKLEPYLMVPITAPFLEFDIGDRRTPGAVHKTGKSRTPSGENPNFLKVLRFECNIAQDALFAPFLNVKVLDHRLAGLAIPVVGTAAISLAPFIPWIASPAELKKLGLTVLASVAFSSHGASGSAAIAATAASALMSGGASASSASASGVGSMSPSRIGVAAAQPEAAARAASGRDLSTNLFVPGEGGADDDDAPRTMDTTALIPKQRDTEMRRNTRPTSAVFRSALSLGGLRNVADVPFVDIEFDENELRPAYMAGRQVYDQDLEKSLTPPFHEIMLKRGFQLNHTAATGAGALADKAAKFGDDLFKSLNVDLGLDDSMHTVGVMKGFIRVFPADVSDPPPPFDIQSLFTPQKYVVRIYVLRGINLMAKDGNGLADPFLKIKLGTTLIDDEKAHLRETVQPEFYKMFELNTTLPGPSQLEIGVWDYNILGTNDLIGSTTIDLENRWFSKEWQKFRTKPLERRSLWSPRTGNPQGKLELWVEIIPKADLSRYPVVNIEPPPKKKYELRVIVWQARNMAIKDQLTNQNDLYVTGRLNEGVEHSTDTHMRAKDGKGSFNYRFVEQIELPMRDPRFRLAAWDFDLVAANDLIGETSINLDQMFKIAYAKNRHVSLMPRRMWLDVMHSAHEGSQGQVQVSIEVMPIHIAKVQPAGVGRKEPNMNPTLDPPDRIKFNILRPDLMLKELLGAELYGRLKNPLICCICCFLLIVTLYLVSQFSGLITLAFKL